MEGQLRIDQLFAFIVKDRDGTEGVAGFLDVERGTWLPMVGADLARVESLRPIAEDLARRLHLPITLAYFSGRRNVEVIEADAETQTLTSRIV